MMHTDKYCNTLDDLPNDQAIRAIHQAWMQFHAMGAQVEVDGQVYDNRPAMDALADCLRAAGHIGWPKRRRDW